MGNNLSNGIQAKGIKATASSVLVRTALGTALIAVTTMLGAPITLNGYVHLGDAFIFLSCIFLSWWAIPAAAVGSVLADFMSGYAIWVPGTFFIKGAMAAIARIIIGRCTREKKPSIAIMIIAFSLASTFMQLAYVAYTYLAVFIGVGGFVVGSIKVMLANLALNLIQTIIGVPLAIGLALRLYKHEFLYIGSRQRQYVDSDNSINITIID